MKELIAENKDGAKVVYKGKSIKGVLRDFDAEWSRRGFKIEVRDEDEVKTIKSSYR